MNNKLKVGIAGYGVVGKRRHKFIDEHPNMIVVAVCDMKFNENDDSINAVKCYRHFNDMIEIEQFDILFVCMPNDVAPDLTTKGLERGCHVFCEKPPGRNVDDIKRVMECEKKHPELKLKYGFNHRYHDSVKDALKLIKSGEMGEIINMRGVYGKSAFIPWPRPSASSLKYEGKKYWRTDKEIAGGGILLDQGIHMVDLMLLFAGKFEKVKSFVKNDFWKHDVEDNAYALMKNKDGVVAFLHSTATQWRHKFNLDITLTGGSIILSGILSGTKSYGQESLTVVYRSEKDNGNPKEQTTNYIEDNSWRDEIYEFVEIISENKKVVFGSSQDALNSMELVYRIYNADDEWRKIINA